MRSWSCWRKGAVFGAVVAALIGGFALRAGVFEKARATHRIEGSTMGTYYTVTYRGPVAPAPLKSAMEMRLSAIESQLSNWDEDSWIRRFNRYDTTGLVAVPTHAYRVIRYSLELAHRTDGALDPTLGGLINLWGFGPFDASSPPDAQAIQEARRATGPGKLTLEKAPPRIAKAHPDLRLNLSAVAKGYALDVLARHLESEQVADYVVNIGGDLRTRGHPRNERAWTVVIQRPDPEAPEGEVHTALDLNTAGIATSGDYRRFRETDGQRYPHLINPKTGRPIQTDLASATIVAPTSMQADGLATACMILGLQKAREMIGQISDVEGLFIQRVAPGRFRTLTSPGWPGTTRSPDPSTAVDLGADIRAPFGYAARVDGAGPFCARRGPRSGVDFARWQGLW